MVLDDIKKVFDALIGQLSPEKAQELAKRYLGRGADTEQVAKAAAELIDLSQRLRKTVRREVASRMRAIGVATQDELDALRKRVRDLERAAGMTASGRKTTARASSARKKTTARTSSSKATGSRRGSTSAS
jgi:5'-deoxynucleotidase YfbR-like HD superfamily hydrolase